MQKLPHRYQVSASSEQEGSVEVSASGLPTLSTAPPAEFGGPGDQWSPETLLTAALADCFILTFRAVARASKLDWRSLRCEAEGTLDRAEGKTRFVEFTLRAELSIPEDGDAEQAHRLLEKAERACLITSSLSGECKLSTEVRAV